jgi:hypothetical protein
LRRDLVRAEAVADRWTWIGFAHLLEDADGD